MSPGIDDYNYDYDYETTLEDDDEVMFDVERLDVEYVDDLALAADELDPDFAFGRDSARHGTSGHRRRRPHARYITSCIATCFTCFVGKIDF